MFACVIAYADKAFYSLHNCKILKNRKKRHCKKSVTANVGNSFIPHCKHKRKFIFVNYHFGQINMYI